MISNYLFLLVLLKSILLFKLFKINISFITIEAQLYLIVIMLNLSFLVLIVI